jgi:hypothetical protein
VKEKGKKEKKRRREKGKKDAPEAKYYAQLLTTRIKHDDHAPDRLWGNFSEIHGRNNRCSANSETANEASSVEAAEDTVGKGLAEDTDV